MRAKSVLSTHCEEKIVLEFNGFYVRRNAA